MLVLVDVFDVGDVTATRCAALSDIVPFHGLRDTLRAWRDAAWGVFSLDPSHDAEAIRAALRRQRLLRPSVAGHGFDSDYIYAASNIPVGRGVARAFPLPVPALEYSLVVSRRLATRRLASEHGYLVAPHLGIAATAFEAPERLVYAWVSEDDDARDPVALPVAAIRVGPWATDGADTHAALYLADRAWLDCPPTKRFQIVDELRPVQDASALAAPSALGYDFVLTYGHGVNAASLSALSVSGAFIGLPLPVWASQIWVGSAPPRCGGDSVHFLPSGTLQTLTLVEPLTLTAKYERSECDALRDVVTSAALRKPCERYAYKGASRTFGGNDLVARRLEAEFTAIGDSLLEVGRQPFTYKDTPGVNVRARLRGQTPDLLVVCAHFDSISTQSTAPGADDNMSGVAAVLSTAELFCRLYSTQHRPKHTVEFILFDAEELGAGGSKYYVANLATENHRAFVAALNIDMAAIAMDISSTDACDGQAAGGIGIVGCISRQFAGFLVDVTEALCGDWKLLAKVAKANPLVYSPNGGLFNDGIAFRYGKLPAVSILERFDQDKIPAGHPTWHLANDTFDNEAFDVDYATDLARILAAAALRLADPR